MRSTSFEAEVVEIGGGKSRQRRGRGCSILYWVWTILQRNGAVTMNCEEEDRPIT